MDGYELLIKPSAVREIEQVPPKPDRRRLLERIETLSEEPRPHGCTKLSGREEYRVRQGSYRIIYAVDDDEQTVLIVKVGYRRDVYR
jgi:mRNA interferase RelE/StbE